VSLGEGGKEKLPFRLAVFRLEDSFLVVESSSITRSTKKGKQRNYTASSWEKEGAIGTAPARGKKAHRRERENNGVKTGERGDLLFF